MCLVIAVGCLVAAVQLWGLIQSLSPPDAYAKDFGQEYLLARVLLDNDGVDPYLPIQTLAARYTGVYGYFDKTIPTPHPPTAGLLLLPLGLLSYVDAVRVWFAIQVVSLVLTVVLLARVSCSKLRPSWLTACSLLLVLWQPAMLDLRLGQLTLPIVCLLAASEWALLQRRGFVGGVLLGSSLLLKPLAWPWLLVLARRRDWYALAGSLATVLGGYALVGLRLGWPSILDYVTRVLPGLSAAYALEPTNISFWTIGPRLLRADSAAATVLSGAVVAAVLVGLWVWSRPPVPSGRALGAATAISVLVNPISWLFYLVLALLPAVEALGWLRQHHWPARATTLAMVVGVLLSVYQPTWIALSGLVGVLGLGPSVAVALLAVFLLALHDRVDSPASTGLITPDSIC